ncbi:H-NS family nucleoid-associated regulatory protein [Neptuniibacter sp. QD37_11]|uniref:H-NS histone family protein n=1 Tax=Neptuniibacter sp. QD37_11 TaxID=3398209 RepID=UPI0039F5B545
MCVVTETLRKKTELRKIVADVEPEMMERYIKNLQELLQEKLDEIASVAAELEARKQKADEIQQAMLDAGLTIDDLVSLAKLPKVSAPKYRMTDNEGQMHEWTGRGRTPLAFQEAFEKGAKKEDFAIQ